METVDCCWAGRRNIDLTCVGPVYSKLLIVGGPMSLVLGEGSRLEILESGYEYLGVLFHVSVLYSYIGIGRNELF